jgi:plastocyanin
MTGRVGIVAIVGVVLIAACGVNSRTEPTERTPGQTNPTTPSISRVSVVTTPNTFVWLEPVFAHDFPPAEGAAYMDQQGQMFMPDTLLVRTGQPVHFRSSEDVLHNVRVIRSDTTPIFNVATPPWGSYTHTFNESGFYNVTCDIHTTMRATMYVASTPYVGTADERGRFTFHDVVPGTYKVAGFADGQRIEKSLDISGARVDVTLP